MRDRSRLAALARLAAAKKDADLIALAHATTERSRIETRLTALDCAAQAARETSVGADDVTALAAQDSFARLVARQRAELDAALARCTEAWRNRRETASQSFGRSQTLARLHEEFELQVDAARARRLRDGA